MTADRTAPPERPLLPAAEMLFAAGTEPPGMATTRRCQCGALLEYRQDMVVERNGHSRTWKCRDCGTPVPGTLAERIAHQHPS
ncbi:MAG: hypothetical protein V5A33_02310 [Halobacteriales archaeon]